jgi:hypothetical protein
MQAIEFSELTQIFLNYAATIEIMPKSKAFQRAPEKDCFERFGCETTTDNDYDSLTAEFIRCNTARMFSRSVVHTFVNRHSNLTADPALGR